MRTLVLLPLLLATAANGAERTWTIARDVYQAEADLIAVRGDLAYLKIDGRVEEIPIERLSAADQQYIASLSLAPIAAGPAAADSLESESNAILPEPGDDREIVQEEMPLPGEPDAPVERSMLHEPDLAPEYGGAPIRQSSPPLGGYRVDQYGRIVPPQRGMAANYLAPQGGWGDNANPNDRRTRRPPQPGPGNQSARSQRDDDDDKDAGILGFRSRRIERQKAAASRSR
jgi:hypothetical protein